MVKQTVLFTKPADTHQYLHSKSCHLRQQKSTVLYSQALRLHYICLQQSDYFTQTEELKHSVTRGYDRMQVQHYIDRATGVKRAQALEDRMPLVVT